MPKISEHAPGTFSWADSGTTDIETAKTFYHAIFGWEYEIADESGYTMCLLEGKPVAGLYTLMGDLIEMGATPYWLPYVAVADADAAMARAVALVATPMGEVFDVPGQGRGGAFADPTGALCGFWQAGGHRGFGLQGEQGTLGWSELQTKDTAAAGGFYSSLFGWEPEVVEMETGAYTVFKHRGANQAGMMAMTPAMVEAHVPPNWAIHFFADNV
ncbi:MAG TPA: VOC family protein, partial [Acidimicrobiia bacterium]|nr:VOC family protein [Acidimicrobiia bacterium]